MVECSDDEVVNEILRWKPAINSQFLINATVREVPKSKWFNSKLHAPLVVQKFPKVFEIPAETHWNFIFELLDEFLSFDTVARENFPARAKRNGKIATTLGINYTFERRLCNARTTVVLR